jgi:hypothetical protein
VVPLLAGHRGPCANGCQTVLDHALITAPEQRDPAMVAMLDAVAGRVLKQAEGGKAQRKAPVSWRVPAGGSPARVVGSAGPVASGCVSFRRWGHEAYHRELTGCVLSHESFIVAEAEAFATVEGNTCRPVMRGATALPGSQTTSCREGPRRNLGDLVAGRAADGCRGPRREGEEP